MNKNQHFEQVSKVSTNKQRYVEWKCSNLTKNNSNVQKNLKHATELLQNHLVWYLLFSWTWWGMVLEIFFPWGEGGLETVPIRLSVVFSSVYLFQMQFLYQPNSDSDPRSLSDFSNHRSTSSNKSFIQIEDGIQMPVRMFCQDRNVLAASFVRKMLKNIGELAYSSNIGFIILFVAFVWQLNAPWWKRAKN